MMGFSNMIQKTSDSVVKLCSSLIGPRTQVVLGPIRRDQAELTYNYNILSSRPFNYEIKRCHC